MKTAHDNIKTAEKAPVIRMGREVPSKKTSEWSPEKDAKCADQKVKAKADRESENKASSLV